MRFTEVARTCGDGSFAERCEREAAGLRRNLEGHGWDGEWYRRAYFDDGSPLGSASNSECQIDSIAQSWSVLSGAEDHERSRMAMEAVDERLVRREHGLIQLLDPPFDKSELNPGYIKGYVPRDRYHCRGASPCPKTSADLASSVRMMSQSAGSQAALRIHTVPSTCGSNKVVAFK
jgi:cellobiose phosphorylase